MTQFKLQRRAATRYAMLTAALLLAAALFALRLQQPPAGLIGRVRSLGWAPGSQLVFVALANSHYAASFINAARMLRGERFLVLCMDKACLTLCTAHHIPCYGGGIGLSVGRLKFGAMRELLDAGYDSLLMDLDLYIVRPPLPAMLAGQEEDFDVAVQRDVNDAPNIGWILCRARPAVADLWRGIEAIYVERPDDIEDHNAYRGQLLFGERLQAAGLRVRRLPLESFTSWMFVDKAALYARQAVHDATVILHMTCAQSRYKEYLGRALGLYREALGYYCVRRPTLETDPLAWNGTQTQLARRLAFAVQAAKLGGRGLVLPKWAWVEHANATHRVPFIRAFSLLSGPLADGLEVLEHGFHQHAARECAAPPPPPVHVPPLPALAPAALASITNMTEPRIVLQFAGGAAPSSGEEALELPEPAGCDIATVVRGWECLQDCP